MKAAVIKKIGQFGIENVPEPECGPDRVKVKIKYCGLCGTDPEILEDRFGLMKGRPPRQGASGPAIIGHEACGNIVEVGKSCKMGYKIGQRVAMNFRSACGVCYYCRNKMEHFCSHSIGATGAYAEYAVYHEAAIYPLPDEISFEKGVLLEPVSIAIHTMDQANITPGKSVMISGAGPIGLLAMEMAIKSGAASVLVSEPVEFKRALAKKLGADVTVNPVSQDVIKVGKEMTQGRGFDVVIEASGNLEAARQSLYLADKGGSVIWAAVYAYDKEIPVNPFNMYANELTIKSVFIAPYSFPRALNMLAKLNLEGIVTDVFPLDEIQEAFEKHKQGKSVKTLIKMY
ncbi:MAG TPA: zinc-binding dehydrogenase [Dehalococcoidales bacterium]|nr:zinc-binding dehydrogenase [Dehalococcoidales bacterium]